MFIKNRAKVTIRVGCNGNGNGNENISNAPPTIDQRRIT